MLIDTTTLIAFVVAAGAVVVSPGPDTMLFLRYTINGGLRVGLSTVAGIQAGLVGHTVLSVTGLSLLIVSLPALFQAIAVAGAVYLAWLALQSIRAGVLRVNDANTRAPGAAKAFRDAMLTNLLNPKVILLFLALMPNFVDTGRSDVPAQLAFLGVLLIVINIVWQVGLCLAAEAVRRWLASPAVQRGVNWVTGGILGFFALFMIKEHVISNDP